MYKEALGQELRLMMIEWSSHEATICMTIGYLNIILISKGSSLKICATGSINQANVGGRQSDCQVNVHAGFLWS
jgi:hypothetical protein